MYQPGERLRGNGKQKGVEVIVVEMQSERKLHNIMYVLNALDYSL